MTALDMTFVATCTGKLLTISVSVSSISKDTREQAALPSYRGVLIIDQRQHSNPFHLENRSQHNVFERMIGCVQGNTPFREHAVISYAVAATLNTDGHGRIHFSRIIADAS